MSRSRLRTLTDCDSCIVLLLGALRTLADTYPAVVAKAIMNKLKALIVPEYDINCHNQCKEVEMIQS